MTIFWLPKTRTLDRPGKRILQWYSKFTQSCLINFNRLCLCMDWKMLYL